MPTPTPQTIKLGSDTTVYGTLTVADDTLYSKTLAADSEGTVVPASASQVFGDAGFTSSTPTWPIEEHDAPTPTVSSAQEEVEE